MSQELLPIIRLITRERYSKDEAYRLRRCMYSARYYVQMRLLAGKTVKNSKYEAAKSSEDNLDS